MNKYFSLLIMLAFLVVACAGESTESQNGNNSTQNSGKTTQKGTPPLDEKGKLIPNPSDEVLKEKLDIRDNPDPIKAMNKRATDLAKLYCNCKNAKNEKSAEVCRVYIEEDVKKLLDKLTDTDQNAAFQKAFDDATAGCKS